MMIIQYILVYLISGILPALLLEMACAKSGFNIGHMERLCLLVLWPLMLLVFLYNFLRAFLKRK